jgi:hypothetical protein
MFFKIIYLHFVDNISKDNAGTDAILSTNLIILSNSNDILIQLTHKYCE